MLDLMNGHIIVGNDVAYEYRAEYDTATSTMYEGWAEWVTGGNATSSSVWRISKTVETVVGTVKTLSQVFAGAGDFIYAWDDRATAFEVSYLLNEDGDFLLTEDGDKIIS